jgi:thymidylate synthase
MIDIPVLNVSGFTLAEGYELALFELYKHGQRIKTQYDKPGDPQSIDATMNITYLYPDQDPMIHKAFPGGIEDLYEYVQELKGRKDRWIKNLDDPKDTRWEYTYHGRLAKWGSMKMDDEIVGYRFVDQVQAVIEKLSKQPYTRQAQMITWMPDLDLECYDPPCLQSLWYRLTDDYHPDHKVLNCNVRFRSNDAWGAHFMNAFGFTMFNKEVICKGIEELTGWKVFLGRMNWQADSFHIYGKDIQQAEERLFNRVKEPLDNIESRIYNFDDPMIQEMWEEAAVSVEKKIQDIEKGWGW